jgi:hypothetical protein
MTTKEIWRLVPSVPGLLASSEGRLMIAPYMGTLHRGGVQQFGGEPTWGQWDGSRFVYSRRGYKTQKVARLVCEAFNGPPQDGQVCMHLDENARNNKPSNLAWGTQKENLNMPKFIEYCKGRTGENSPTTKGRRKLEMA